MKRFLVLFLAFCMVFTLAACGGDGEAPDTGTTLDIAVCFAPEPDTIDPALNTSIDGAIMLQHSFEGLVKWADDGRGNATLVPGAAERWDVSEDGKTYTFHLREGARWSDGEPVTAHDFEYAWKRAVDPNTMAGYSALLDCVLNGPEIIYGIQGDDPDAEAASLPADELAAVALDDMTFEVTLHTAIPYFTEIVALPVTFPVRRDIIEQYGDQWTFKPSTYISNGPYMMSDWVHNSYITMVKNPNHYDYENLGPDSIKFALMDNDNAMLAAFNIGELDFNSGYPIDEVTSLLESGQLKIADYIGTYFISFQAKQHPFDNPLVREAFSLVIDRNYIVKQITRAGEVAADGYVPAGIYDAGGVGSDFRETGGGYYSLDDADYAANCERARELLAEAGYPGGEGFPIVEYIYNTGDQHRAIGEALQNIWQTELGVQVTLANQDWSTFMGTRRSGDYSIARNGGIAGYNDPISFLEMWVSDAGNNDAQYSNAEYDGLIMLAKSSSDPTVRMQALHDAEDILMGEHVVAPIYFYTQPYMVSEDLKGWYYTPLGFFFFSYATK